MKIIIALSLLSIAVALPRPGVLLQPVELIPPKFPEIQQTPEILSEKVRVVDIVDAPENDEIHFVEASEVLQESDSVKVVDGPADQITNEFEAISYDDTLNQVQVVDFSINADQDLDSVKFVDSPMLALELVAADSLTQEKVQVVDSPISLDQDLEIIKVDDNIISELEPNLHEQVQVVNAVKEPETVRVVDAPFFEAPQEAIDTSLVDKVQVVDSPMTDNQEPIQDIVHFVDGPELEVQFVDTPSHVHEKVVVVNSPVAILEAVQRVIEQVRVVDSPMLRDMKYQNPLLR